MGPNFPNHLKHTHQIHIAVTLPRLPIASMGDLLFPYASLRVAVLLIAASFPNDLKHTHQIHLAVVMFLPHYHFSQNQ